jgi:deoxyribodipyrimidine photolyase-related protein
MGKISVWILGDQLLDQHPALNVASEISDENVSVVLIESMKRIRHRPCQRKKLILLLSAMRHYGHALQACGYDVDYIQAKTFLDGLREHVHKHQPQKILTMAAATYPGRELQASLEDRLGVEVEILPNMQFLLGTFNPFPKPTPEKRYVMERFYRAMRTHFDVLMQDGEPVGGRWNYDQENRKNLPKDLEPPADLSFEPDDITKQVIAEIESLQKHIGTVEDFQYAVTREQAIQTFQYFIDHKLSNFGPYEDAMTPRSHSLFHSVLSPYLNIGLLHPLEMVKRVEQVYAEDGAPINSVEGYIRQILGWREFMYWQYWRFEPALVEKNEWKAWLPVPDFFWTGETEMACLRHTISRAIDTGYNHHIERLMILSNFCMLTAMEPKAVNEWFLTVYIDAYDWVMSPNVIGMGLNADGGLIATKPYISSANYINRMSDFCKECPYDHRSRVGDKACPYNFLYWNFILEHEERLRSNPRTSRNVLGLRHLSEQDCLQVRKAAKDFIKQLSNSGE